jgi:hypothetical protein
MKKIIFVIAVSMAFLSCIKETTPGPTGPRGPQGPPGKDGTQINTHYIDVYPNQWKKFETFSPPKCYSFVEKSLPALTSSVIDGGAVLAYVLMDDCDQQLPYVVSSIDGGYYYTRVIRYDLQKGIIGFVVEDSDFNVPTTPYNEIVTFKVVIISKI